jgi:hypothetical protein
MMDVDPAFVSNGEPSAFVEPGEAALDDPAVATEFLAGLNAAPGDAGLDLTAQTSAAAATVIVGFVGVQLIRPAPWSTALACHGRNGVEQVFEGYAVVNVGPGQDEGERDTAAIGDQVTFGAWSSPIRRVRTCRGAPFFAAMDELSMQARLQSIRSASRSRRSNSQCRRSHTPAACQSRNRRQQVTPEPHPISAGSISHGMPVRRTNRIPVNAARAGTGGRPPLGFRETGGSSGSMISHSDSGTRGVGIPSHESTPLRVQGF